MSRLTPSHSYIQKKHEISAVPPQKGRFSWVKKLVIRCVGHIVGAQNEFNANVTRCLNEVTEKNEQLIREVEQLRRDAAIAAQERQTFSGWRDTHESIAESLETRQTHISDEVRAMEERAAHHHEELREHAKHIEEIRRDMHDHQKHIGSLYETCAGISAREDDIVTQQEKDIARMDAIREELLGFINDIDVRQEDLVTQQETAATELHSLEAGMTEVSACIDETAAALDSTMRTVESARDTAESAHAGVESLDHRFTELNETLTVVRDIAHDASARLDRLTREVRDNHADSAARTAEAMERIAHMEQGFTDVRTALARITRYNTYLRNALDDLLHLSDSLEITDTQKLEDAAEAFHGIVRDTEYEMYEDAFRGDVREIQKRCEVYVPYLKESKAAKQHPVLDLGCGRGEFVAVLEENGYEARGVDLNAAAVSYAQEEGISVREEDAFDTLEACKADTLGAVSALHLVEHMPFSSLRRLVQLCGTRLAPGGILIIETPNACSLRVAASEFYRDPTHIRPVHPHVLEFLVHSAALETVDTLYLHPYDEEEQLITGNVSRSKKITANFSKLNDLVYGCRDVAVIARKPGKASGKK